MNELRRRLALAQLWVKIVRARWRDRHNVPRLRRPNAPTPEPPQSAEALDVEACVEDALEQVSGAGGGLCEDPLNCRCLRCVYWRTYGDGQGFGP